MKKKITITYNGQPLTEGTIVRFRNGKHGNEVPIWQAYQEGAVSGIIDRPKPIRTMPAGITDFAVVGADIEFRHDSWNEQYKTYDGEDFLVEIPGLQVTITHL